MGRKNLLQHLIDGGQEDTPQPPDITEAAGFQPSHKDEVQGEGQPESTPQVIRRDRPAGRSVGIVGAVSGTFDTLSNQLRQAQERLSTGEVVVEISAEDIEPSFVSDRLGFDKDMDELTASIRDHGQRTPILVRPHPDMQGRYQIAFGHRRYLALRALGRPVRAMIKPLSDDELVIAQGQENNARVDLTFIERSLFAHRLERRKFSRTTICAALSVDHTAVSRMLWVATAIPDELILAIGAAEKSGRRKWIALAKAFEAIDWEEVRDKLLAVCAGSRGLDSDRRLEAVMAEIAEMRPRPSKPQAPVLTVERRPGYVRIRYDAERFSEDAVEELVSQVNRICKKLGGKP